MSAYEALTAGRFFLQDCDIRAPRYSPKAAHKAFRKISSLFQSERVSVWDPFCGSGTGVYTLAVMHRQQIERIYASDIRESAVMTTHANLCRCIDQVPDRVSLSGGLNEEFPPSMAVYRHPGLIEVLQRYGAESSPLDFTVFKHNALSADGDIPIPESSVDLLLTDPPYGDDCKWMDGDLRLSPDVEVRIQCLSTFLLNARPRLRDTALAGLVLSRKEKETMADGLSRIPEYSYVRAHPLISGRVLHVLRPAG